MCFKPKMSVPKVNTNIAPIDPEPLKEEPKGIDFGGDDEKTENETSGRKSLKVKRDKGAGIA